MEMTNFTGLLILFIEISLIAIFCVHLIDRMVYLKRILFIVALEIIFFAIVNLIPQMLVFYALIQAFFLSFVLSVVCRVRFNAAFLTALIGLSVYFCIEELSGLLIIAIYTNFNFVIGDIARNFILLGIKTFFFVIAFIFLKNIDIRFIDNYRCFVSHFRIADSDKKNIIFNDYSILSILMFAFYIFSFIISSNFSNSADECILYKTMSSIQLPSLISGIVLPIIAIIMLGQLIKLVQNKINSSIHIDSLQNVKELINLEKTQRHDFNHELQVTYGLLEMGAFSEAKNYLRKSIKEIALISNTINIDNFGIASLLYMKKCISEAKGIGMDVEVKSSFRELQVSERDIILVLGNLIDNSIESVEELEENDEKSIRVNLYFEYNCYIIEVLNPGVPINSELLKKMFLPGFSTKKKGMGMGLYSVKRIVKKYNGHIEVLYQDGLNCFKVVIPASGKSI